MEEILLNGSCRQSDERLLLDHREINIGTGAEIRLTSGFAPQPVCLKHDLVLQEHQVGFNFCLKGKQQFALSGNYSPTQADPAKCNILLLPAERFSTRMELVGEFSTATFFIPLAQYLDILGENAVVLPKNFLIAAERKNLCYFKNHDWDPRIRQVLNQVMHRQFSPLSNRIFLESKMLELIAVLLDMDHCTAEKRATISQKDEAKIRHAGEILVQRLADPPSLSGLARLVGTNEFALKKGFKQVFGIPVFQYLQQLRMAKALDLLCLPEYTVGEVALAVGYDNFSAFTRVFRQTHGVTPSDWRKTPFLHR